MLITEIYTLLTELSLVQVNALWNSSDSKKSDQILAWRYNIPITRKSFNTIHMVEGNDQNSGWLNDEVKRLIRDPNVVHVVLFVLSFSCVVARSILQFRYAIRSFLLTFSSNKFLFFVRFFFFYFFKDFFFRR